MKAHETIRTFASVEPDPDAKCEVTVHYVNRKPYPWCGPVVIETKEGWPMFRLALNRCKTIENTRRYVNIGKLRVWPFFNFPHAITIKPGCADET